MNWLGDFAEDSTVRIYFTTHDGSGGAVAPSTAFESADIIVYKDGSATQKTSTNGLTMTSPFDSVTGLHLIELDTSNDTGDAGFWVTGSDYTVILSPDETVDSQTVVKVLSQFSIENRLNGLSASEVNAEVSDVIKTDTVTLPGQEAPTATPTLETILAYLYKVWRNKKDNDGSTTQYYADNGTTVDHKQTTSESAGTVTKAEVVSGP